MIIDKFTEKAYPESEREPLKYVNDFLISYVEHWDFDCDDGTPYRFVSSTPSDNFKHRYNNRKISNYFKYEDYIKNDEIQSTLSALEIDSEKFWYLLLLLYDFSCGACFEGVYFAETPKEKLTKLIDAVNGNIKNVNKTGEVTFDKATKLTLSIKGKHNIIIDNPYAIVYLMNLCGNDLISNNNFHLRTTTFSVGKEESNSVHIWFFSSLFMEFFKMNPQIKSRRKKGSDVSLSKMLLISRLVYFTKLSVNDSFRDDEQTLKGFIKQYKDYKMDKQQNGYYSDVVGLLH